MFRLSRMKKKDAVFYLVLLSVALLFLLTKGRGYLSEGFATNTNTGKFEEILVLVIVIIFSIIAFIFYIILLRG